MRLLTTVAGKINEADFRAEGQSECPELGRSLGELRFNKRIPNFTPMLCRSWTCKQHFHIARIALSEANPLAVFLDSGGRIMEYTTIEYPSTEDKILVTSTCVRPQPGLQVVYQTRVGNYAGPFDIVEQLPFNVELTPIRPGFAEGFSVRQVVRSNGERILIRYYDQIFFSHNFALSLPLSFEISGEANYLADELRFVLNTQIFCRQSAASLPTTVN